MNNYLTQRRIEIHKEMDKADEEEKKELRKEDFEEVMSILNQLREKYENINFNSRPAKKW